MRRSYGCKGCTNFCYMIYDGEVGTYCRTTYDQPKHRGYKWEGEMLRCLDYTTDPRAEDKQIRMWSAPKYERKVHE